MIFHSQLFLESHKITWCQTATNQPFFKHLMSGAPCPFPIQISGAPGGQLFNLLGRWSEDIWSLPGHGLGKSQQKKKPLSLIPVTYRAVIFWRSTGEKLSWIVTIDVESNVGRIKRWMAMHFCMNGGFGTVLTCDIFSQRRFVQDDFADMWFYASQKQPLTLFLIANLAPLPNNIK